MTTLTEKQQAFVEHYVENGGNGAQAAIAAGYAENSAKQEAYSLLRKPHIVKAIEAATLDTRAKYGPGAMKTLALLMNSDNEKTRLAAAQTLAKMSGLEIQKQEITFKGDESLEEIESQIESVCKELGVANPLKLVADNG